MWPDCLLMHQHGIEFGNEGKIAKPFQFHYPRRNSHQFISHIDQIAIETFSALGKAKRWVFFCHEIQHITMKS